MGKIDVLGETTCKTLGQSFCNCTQPPISSTTSPSNTRIPNSTSSDTTTGFPNSTDIIFMYNDYLLSSLADVTTTVTPHEIVDVTSYITYSSSPSSTTSQPGGQIIDVENRITYSTSSGTTKSGGSIVDAGNNITYPTSHSPAGSNDDSKTTSGNGGGIVDVSQLATRSTSSVESTVPWTEYAKAADSNSSTTLSSSSDSTSSSTNGSDVIGTASTDSSGSSGLQTVIITTMNPSCAIQCPDGYIAGTSLCFLIADSSSIKSYQSALSYCQTANLRNLISLEHLRNLNDLQLLKTKVNSLSSTTWFFANGGGSVRERFDKKAQVFDINMLTAMTSPIEMTVGISDATSNVSAICVLPQYCNISTCYVESALNVLDLNTILSTSEETIDTTTTTRITCSYTKAVTTVTCGTRGNMMPNPTTINCEAAGASQKLRNTTSELVASCAMCLTRGTDTCTEVTDEEGKTGYSCNCKEAYSMSTCWYTSDSCTVDTCNRHGKCSDTLGTIKCDCDWGYEGDSCQVNKDRVTNTTDPFFTRLGNYIIDFPTIYALQTNTWTLITVFAKSLGKVYLSNGEDDPQETHQAARAFFMTLGTSCVLFFNDPYLFKISQATCRMFFILIHFCFMGAMIQWMLEGYNANQVVRCVHLNEWERDFKRKRAWGIMAAPRMIIPLILLAVALAVIFKSSKSLKVDLNNRFISSVQICFLSDWWYLPSTWTCVGVICNQTTSVWLSAIWIALCLVLSTAAFAESSVLLKHRRPLFNLKIRQRIERDVGVIDGWVAEKCRRNTVLCFIGVLLLSLTWLFTILASDKRSKYIFGWSLMIISTIYGMFSFCQGLYTDPNCWSRILWFAMKRFPARFAPSYDPVSMWTREEVKQIQKLPKDQQELIKEEMLTLNKKLFLNHKWDLELNEKLENGSETPAALMEILRCEIKKHHDLSGSQFQKQQLQETFAEFVKSVVDRPPRIDLLSVNAKSEAVTLCAEKEDGTARVTKFMLVPDIDIFEPEEFYEDADDIDKKRMNMEVDKETYKIAREEAVSQNNFMNSAIKFKFVSIIHAFSIDQYFRYYGKIKA
ncbi:hypothetical protein CAEBREN_32286 [Caenorhabditis brenneri]|uniref:EGF-like domain-containing protein n=1 Tax=Caenorhabditis brenneri TaxID=135651 RepID=G0NXX5_CAEBE|nr:hypothetical protein CAEBREN_32286 [Caenorhabditis brenneri]